MKGERPMMERTESEPQKKPEMQENKAEKKESGEKSELMSLNEFLKEAGETMNSVVQALERERGYAAEVRKMGARVTRETAQKIADLEKQRDRLQQEVDEAAHDLAFTSWVATKRENAGEKPLDEMLVKKLRTPELEELLNDPDAIDITDEMVVEVQSEVELKVLEKQLQEEADNAQFEMADIIEQLHDIKKNGRKPAPPKWDPELFMSLKGVLDERTKELEGRIAEAAALDRPEEEMDQLDKFYAAQRAEEVKKMQAELASLDMDKKKMLKDRLEPELERLANRDEHERIRDEALLNEALAGVLEARFNDLQNYTRVLKEKIKDVRADLGLIKSMDDRPTKKMPPPLPKKAA